VSRMFDRIEKGEAAVGTVMLEHGPEWAELIGHAGMDFACIDMMVTSIDWREAADVVRACTRFDVTPWIRLQAFPWGGTDLDPRLPADVLRAISMGFEGVLASVNTPAAVAAMLQPLTEGHHRPYLSPKLAIPGLTPELSTLHDQEPWIFPLIESLEAVDNLENICEVDGLKAIMLGMGDLTRLLKQPHDRTPEVRKLVTDTVKIASEHDVAVISVSMAAFRHEGRDTPESVAEGIEWLWNAGVKVVWTPHMTAVAQRFYERVFANVAQHEPKARPIV
jgi:2-keto-3-deoxy-L-rhamnonate aldolase RhmA